MRAGRWGSTLAALTGVVGLSVLLGWALGVRAAVSWVPGVATSKPTTAMSFIVAGAMLLALRRSTQRAHTVGVMLAMALLSMMGLMLIDVNTPWDSGLRTFLITEHPDWAVDSVAPGEPSVGTMLGFITLGFAGMLHAMDWTRAARVSGVVVAVLGLVGVLGHALGVPVLYWLVPGKSSAMALPTCVMFLSAGVSVRMLPWRRARTRRDP